MKRFADLFASLDETTKTNAKIAALADYFMVADAADAAWAVYFLTGRKPKQVVPTRFLRQWALEAAKVPDWLFDESYHAVGDLAETMALLMPEAPVASERPLHEWVEERLLPLRGADEGGQRRALLQAWAELDARQRFLWNKLITGAFRVGVSQQMVILGIARAADLAPSILAHRLMGEWRPTPEFFRALVAPGAAASDPSRPYPYFLATPLEGGPEQLGDISEWLAEWKWDGIRSQLIRRSGLTFLWSRGEELVTERFPEISAIGDRLPEGTVIDGEILPWNASGVLPFAELQRRIGRKSLTKKVLAEAPVTLLAYDLLEEGGVDLRELPLEQRRSRLAEIVAAFGPESRLKLSPTVEGESYADLAHQREASRQRNVEGLMLKRRSSPYRVGRVRGDWWKWKIDPYAIDAVLVYAQRGNGKRASLYTDYTFAVWDDGKLVPFAKAYSGLTDAEIRQVDAFIRKNTVEKFGPVRTVKPEMVFEIGFEGIARSTRHKSGIAVRFPRILRWRTDKTIDDADKLETLQAMVGPETPEEPNEQQELF
ncbi:MAG: ATP-dependent DNA ligase [Gemmataceae bacterium]|nr:ATP-dependent DNA ligase [Gemmataceae bacterium]